MKTDNIVTPENTKLIAEWMGLEVEEYNKDIYKKNQYCGESWNTSKYFMSASTYNLITNSDQSREVEEKLLGLWWKLEKNVMNNNFSIKLCVYEKGVFFTKHTFEAETLPLVIYKAALYEAKK